MSSTPGEITVRHNASDQRYEAEVDGQLCVADYEKSGDRMIFTHTYVPTSLRGRGIAAKLVRTALEDAREQKLKVVPQCSYVAVFLQRHREFQSLADGV